MIQNPTQFKLLVSVCLQKTFRVFVFSIFHGVRHGLLPLTRQHPCPFGTGYFQNGSVFWLLCLTAVVGPALQAQSRRRPIPLPVGRNPWPFIGPNRFQTDANRDQYLMIEKAIQYAPVVMQRT